MDRAALAGIPIARLLVVECMATQVLCSREALSATWMFTGVLFLIFHG